MNLLSSYRILQKIFSLPSFLLIVLIRIYRYVLSPFLGTKCRFSPTCSLYSIEALEKHGFFIALMLIIRRLCRCNPFGACGIDNVPQTKVWDYFFNTNNKQ